MHIHSYSPHPRPLSQPIEEIFLAGLRYFFVTLHGETAFFRHKRMIGNRLYKTEKLCSKLEIDSVFGGKGKGVTAYPLRAVYTVATDDTAPTRFLISIPKKRHRHAVDRVLLRRRVREAYRLNRHLINQALTEARLHVNVVFIYLSDKILPYTAIERRMQDLLIRIAAEALKPHHDEEGN